MGFHMEMLGSSSLPSRQRRNCFSAVASVTTHTRVPPPALASRCQPCGAVWAAMPSPLAISNFILSQNEASGASDGHSAPKMSYYRDALQPNPVPVLLRVRRMRIFLGALASTTALAGVTYALTKGVTVATISHDEYTTQPRRSALVQDYNGYVGLLVALLGTPLQALVALVLPISLWCFFTDRAMSTVRKESTRMKTLAMSVSIALTWMLSNAFHGINVQLVPHSSGVGVTKASASKSFSDTTRSNQDASIIDSILRSAVTMDYRRRRSVCSRSSPVKISSGVEYGFRSRNWMKRISFSNNTVVAQSEVGVAPSVLPMHPSSAQSLAAYSFPLMHAFFEPSSSPSAAKDSQLVSSLWPRMDSELSSAISSSFTTFVTDSSSQSVRWIDTKRVDVSYTSWNLSHSIQFDSVSFDMPLRADYMQRKLVLDNDTTSSVSYNNMQSDDYYFEINVKEECGEDACIVSPRGELPSEVAADDGAQIRALNICLNTEGEEDVNATLQQWSYNGQPCSQPSTQSFFVFSFAQRLEGEALTQSSNNTVQLKNAKKFLSVTVGRVTLLAEELRIESSGFCDNDTPCTGSYLPLEGGNSVVVATSIPQLKSLSSNRSPSTWTLLAGVSVREIDAGGALKGDLVLPSQFSSASSLSISSSQCEVERGNLLASVQKNHWYSLSSTRQAAAAALLWVFQDGVEVELRDPTANDHTATSSSAPKSASSDLVVTIPKLSAILTYCGCAVVLMLSVAILLFSKRSETWIEKHYSPFHLAQTLVGASSPLVPAPCLLNSDLLNVGGDLLSSSESVTEFDIVSLTLRHRQVETTIVHVPKPFSISASRSASAV